jgi:hypothetical protein
MEYESSDLSEGRADDAKAQGCGDAHEARH